MTAGSSILHRPSTLVHPAPADTPLEFTSLRYHRQDKSPTLEPTISRWGQGKCSADLYCRSAAFLAHRRRGEGGRRPLFCSACDLPAHFVEAGFSRAALRGDRHYPGAAQKSKPAALKGASTKTIFDSLAEGA